MIETGYLYPGISIACAIFMVALAVVNIFTSRSTIRAVFMIGLLVCACGMLITLYIPMNNAAKGESVEFEKLKENHRLKLDSYSETMKIGIISDHEGRKKGDRRLVKNIPPEIKPGELFTIRDKQVFVYRVKLIESNKKPEVM
jgi:hypothetical protein